MCVCVRVSRFAGGPAPFFGNPPEESAAFPLSGVWAPLVDSSSSWVAFSPPCQEPCRNGGQRQTQFEATPRNEPSAKPRPMQTNKASTQHPLPPPPKKKKGVAPTQPPPKKKKKQEKRRRSKQHKKRFVIFLLALAAHSGYRSFPLIRQGAAVQGGGLRAEKNVA